MLSAPALLRYLGPWTGPQKMAKVKKETIDLGPFRAHLYEPNVLRGAYLIAPGLHYEGADDPRMDRFCRALCAAGARVLAPLIPDYLNLLVLEKSADDFELAFDHLNESVDFTPGVFSISFGSYLALRLAAQREEIKRLVVFGGFCRFSEVVRFSLDDESERKNDPLNRPVVVANLMDFFEDPPSPEEKAAYMKATHAFVRATWGREEMKAPERFLPEAHRILHTLRDPRVRDFFEVGTGLKRDANERCEWALTHNAPIFEFLELEKTLPNLNAKVALFHGTDDTVIPYENAEHMHRALSPSSQGGLHLSGLYSHTESGMRAKGLVREMKTTIAMMRTLQRYGKS